MKILRWIVSIFKKRKNKPRKVPHDNHDESYIYEHWEDYKFHDDCGDR